MFRIRSNPGVCLARIGVMIACWFLSISGLAARQSPKPIPRCQVKPLAGHRVSFRIDGIEKTRWHFGREYPRPLFYPLNGPAGVSLTRMGHPGAPNHDHHRSIWFAHHSVNGIDFWSENGQGRIRQRQWLAYSDGDTEAIMAVLLDWVDGDGVVVMEQQVAAALRSASNFEHQLEIQISMQPSANRETVVLGKTNFGFLAVRVARSISGYFGGGTIANSEGRIGEKNIFGKRARWMDYSGPIAIGQGLTRRTVTEGITYFDHPSNPRYPTYWHVREDGWMGASFGMHASYTITRDKPLVLRYLLHTHSGAYDSDKAAEMHADFAARPGFEVTKRTRPHGQFDVGRTK